MPDVEVGGAPPAQGAGGFFSNRKNVLLTAGILGAAIGGVIFLTSRNKTPSTNAQTAGIGGTPMDQLSIQLGNIATQMLQFRGDWSVMSQKELDATNNVLTNLNSLASAFSNSETSRQLYQQWQQYSAGAAARELELHTSLIDAQRRGDATSIDDLTRQIFALRGQEQTVWHSMFGQQTPQTSTPEPASQVSLGAGGFAWQDWIPWPAYDAGMGDGDQLAVMGSAPVRYIGDLADFVHG